MTGVAADSYLSCNQINSGEAFKNLASNDIFANNELSVNTTSQYFPFFACTFTYTSLELELHYRIVQALCAK